MKKMVFLIALSILFVAADLWAYGLGGYFTLGESKNMFTGAIDKTHYNAEFGGGFVFDTNLSGELIFNYRLKAGYGVNIFNANNEPIFHQFRTSHLFAFAPVAKKDVRLFMGPLFGVDYLYNDQYKSNIIDICEIDAGAVLIGVNANFEPSFTVSVEAGGRYSWFFGQERDGSRICDLRGIKGNSFEAFIQVSLFWRNEATSSFYTGK